MSERLFRSLGPVMGPTNSCVHNTVLQYRPTVQEQECILSSMPAFTTSCGTAGIMHRCTASHPLKIMPGGIAASAMPYVHFPGLQALW